MSFKISRRIWRFIASMRVAAILIAAIAILAALGSLIPQMPPQVVGHAEAEAKWLAGVSVKLGGHASLYHRLGLFRFYETFWFRGLVFLLAGSTLACTANRIGPLWRQVFRPSPRRPAEFFTKAGWRATPSVLPANMTRAMLRTQLRTHGYRRIIEVEEGGARFLYADRHHLAALATLVTHLGLVALIPCALVAATGKGASYTLAAGAFWLTLLLISLSMAASFYWPHDRLWAQISPVGQILLAALPGGEAGSFERRFQQFLKSWSQSLERTPMSEGQDFEHAIPVNSVPEEYEYLRRQRCTCGGAFKFAGQALYEHQGRSFDVLHVRCEKCGAARDYTFDINSFYGSYTQAGRVKAWPQRLRQKPKKW